MPLWPFAQCENQHDRTDGLRNEMSQIKSHFMLCTTNQLQCNSMFFQPVSTHQLNVAGRCCRQACMAIARTTHPRVCPSTAEALLAQQNPFLCCVQSQGLGIFPFRGARKKRSKWLGRSSRVESRRRLAGAATSCRSFPDPREITNRFPHGIFPCFAAVVSVPSGEPAIGDDQVLRERAGE